MVDANHAYSVPTAVSLAKQMEKFNISWFEEPVVPEDIDGYRRVQSKTYIPIAGGECSFMRYGFRDLFVGKCKARSSSENMTNMTGRGGPCVEIAQPDIAAAGGLTEFQKISALGKHCHTINILSHSFILVHLTASSFGVSLVPHVWGSGVGLAAALHAVSTLPLTPYTCNPGYLENMPVIEFDR